MDQVIFVNQWIRADLMKPEVLGQQFRPGYNLPGLVSSVTPPVSVSKGVTSAVYDAYRLGLDSACADVVIATRRGDEPLVLAVKRGMNKPFANKWWMQGGAIHTYRPILEFLEERAEKECGVKPEICAFMCLTRTCAPDFLASTTQPCFLGIVPYEALSARYDGDHSASRLFSAADLDQIPKEEQHWYPMFAFSLALEALRTRNSCD